MIDTFDFTISMLGTDGRCLYFGEYTWTDLLRKRLRVHHIHHGISTMRRMVKYSHRGFYACVGTMRDVAQGVVNAPSDQPISVDWGRPDWECPQWLHRQDSPKSIASGHKVSAADVASGYFRGARPHVRPFDVLVSGGYNA